LVIRISCPCSELVKHYVREDIRGRGGIAPIFLTSELDGGEWSVSGPGSFTPGERVL
jgi:hypothetical protein